MRLRVVSASAERWSRMAGGREAINPSIRIEGYIGSWPSVKARPIRRTLAISEPTTLVTDYLLGILCAVLAWRLVTPRLTPPVVAVRLWGAALGAAGLASFVGGTYHGFQHALGAMAATALWKTTTLSMGLASFLLLAAAFTSSFSREARRWVIAAAALKLGIYAVWMLGHNEFRFVIYDYGSTLVILMLLVAAGRTQGRPGHRAYIASGILVSIAAAAIQQSGVRLHHHFNHNDLMHVVQMGGMWLLYKGGARLQDSGGFDGRQP